MLHPRKLGLELLKWVSGGDLNSSVPESHSSHGTETIPPMAQIITISSISPIAQKSLGKDFQRLEGNSPATLREKARGKRLLSSAARQEPQCAADLGLTARRGIAAQLQAGALKHRLQHSLIKWPRISFLEQVGTQTSQFPIGWPAWMETWHRPLLAMKNRRSISHLAKTSLLAFIVRGSTICLLRICSKASKRIVRQVCRTKCQQVSGAAQL